MLIAGLEMLSAMTGCCKSDVQINDARKEAKIVKTISDLTRPDLLRESFLLVPRGYSNPPNSHLDSTLDCGVSFRKLEKP